MIANDVALLVTLILFAMAPTCVNVAGQPSTSQATRTRSWTDRTCVRMAPTDVNVAGQPSTSQKP